MIIMFKCKPTIYVYKHIKIAEGILDTDLTLMKTRIRDPELFQNRIQDPEPFQNRIRDPELFQNRIRDPELFQNRIREGPRALSKPDPFLFIVPIL